MYLQVPECYQVENIIATCHYSIHFLFYFKIYNFFFKWHILINYAGDGYCRFRVTLGIPLTMPNKKYFFDFLLLKMRKACWLNIIIADSFFDYDQTVPWFTIATITHTVRSMLNHSNMFIIVSNPYRGKSTLSLIMCTPHRWYFTISKDAYLNVSQCLLVLLFVHLHVSRLGSNDLLLNLKIWTLGEALLVHLFVFIFIFLFWF